MDPYKILGVLPHASSKEIKDAYAQIIESYNADESSDDSAKTFNLERQSEANEAFRLITLEHTLKEVRTLIDCDNFITAESKLNLVADNSSAEWNYLKGVLLLRKGWIDSGVSHIKKATSLNPYNNEYIDTMKQLDEKVKVYKQNFSRNKNQNGLNLCNTNTQNPNNSSNGNKNGLC